MKTKHTPGKWKYYNRGAQVFSDNPYGRGPMLVADVRGWGHLTGTGCGACKMHPEDAEDIQNANGRLIAAAPRMLEIIKQVARTQAQFSPEARKLIKELEDDDES